MPDDQEIPRNQAVAALFRRLADEIELNAPERFAGAFLLVPPEGEAKDMVLLNRQQDVALFWGTLKTTAEIALAELQEKDRNASAFGIRR